MNQGTEQKVTRESPASPELFGPVKELLSQTEKTMYDLLAAGEPLVGEVATHLLRGGGKRVRPALVLLGAGLAGDLTPYEPVLLDVAASVELIHMATLVHDDIVDESDLRRGVATVHSRWNDQIGVLSGDYLFARAFTALAQTGDNRVVRIMADVVSEMSIGEITQLGQAYQEQTTAEYLKRVFRKTAFFIAQSCRVGGVVAGMDEQAEDALASYGHGIGMAYQLVDDILDFVGSEEEFGKPVGSDLRAGLYTLPLLYALVHSSQARELQQLVEQAEDITPDEMTRIMQLVQASGAIEHSYSEAKKYIEAAKAALEHFQPSPAREAMLGLAEFIRERHH